LAGCGKSALERLYRARSVAAANGGIAAFQGALEAVGGKLTERWTAFELKDGILI
jgi:hypothetical protein